MAVPSSGSISLAHFHQEFGLGYSFNSYRGKGSVPGSGQIWFSQMYGAANQVREPGSGYVFDWNYYYFANGNIRGGNFFTYCVWNGTTVNAPTAGTLTSFSSGGATYYRGPTYYGDGDDGAFATWSMYDCYRTIP